MQHKSEGIYIQANNESGIINLDLYVKTKRIHTANEKEAEELCGELLSQLKILSDTDGKLTLSIVEYTGGLADEVIYRRGHYISSRYFTITIYENHKGVHLVASENEKNVFRMKLGRHRVGNSQKVQEELAVLVKKLRIQNVLGQEELFLSFN